MSKCEKIQAVLSDYRTDLLNAMQRCEVEEHISECKDCARELELLDSVLAMVESNIPEYEPPAALWNGVYNQITAPTPRRVGFTSALRGWFATPMRAAGAGLAALVIAGALVFGGPHGKPVEPLRMAPADEYVQGHALYASQALSTDRAAYLALVAESSKLSRTN